MSQFLERIKDFTKAPNLPELKQTLSAAKSGDEQAQLEICGALLWVGFACPAAIGAVYDSLFIPKVTAKFDLGDQAPIPETFWQAFQETLDGPEGGYDPTSITATVAALGGATDMKFHELAEQAAADHPGADQPHQKTIPPLLALEDLAQYDEDTLGKTLYTMLVENGYDAEVLDRDAIGLTQLPPAMQYVNTRILQMHDVWHLVAGYETTGLHEIAISAFQLAQFGHNYSAMFLATVATLSQRNGTDGFNLMMTVYEESWKHGRETPPLMAIEFEGEWGETIPAIRSRFKIEPYQSVFPADMFEQLRAAG
jgi:ubiquinone biosynthesis protein Coq4